MIGISFDVDCDGDEKIYNYLHNFFDRVKYRKLCGTIYDKDKECYYYFFPKVRTPEDNIKAIIRFLNDLVEYCEIHTIK
jgi:hypothetical protein